MTTVTVSEEGMGGEDVGPHIVKMAPHLVEKVWGGRKLKERFGKELWGEGPFGESWEVADLAEGQSLVSSGRLRGRSLGELSKAWGRALVGRKAAEADRFPLLVKLLDARRDLSVQVHPGPEAAGGLAGARSKDEAWLILDAEAGAAVIHGLSQDGVRAEDFRRAVDAGLVGELLERVPVAAGDVVRVSPGTIHAICEGVALLEIQEPSDTTYRVYDYGRPGLDGNPRALHLEEAMQVSRLGRSEQVVVVPTRLGEGLELLVEAPGYRIERLSTEGACRLRWSVDPDSPQVLHVLEGSLEVDDGLGGTVKLERFETAVVPASAGAVVGHMRQAGQIVVSGLAVTRCLVQALEVEEGAAVVW